MPFSFLRRSSRDARAAPSSNTDEGASTAGGDPAASAPSANRPTAANFQTDARVIAIDALATDIGKKIDATQLRKEERALLCGDAGGEYSRTTFSLGDRIRSLVFMGAVEDSNTTETYYYDEAGKLRLVKKGWSASSDRWKADARQYFEQDGTEIISVVREAGDGSGTDCRSVDLTRAKYQLLADGRSELRPRAKDDPRGAVDPVVSPPLCM